MPERSVEDALPLLCSPDWEREAPRSAPAAERAPEPGVAGDDEAGVAPVVLRSRLFPSEAFDVFSKGINDSSSMFFCRTPGPQSARFAGVLPGTECRVDKALPVRVFE